MRRNLTSICSSPGCYHLPVRHPGLSKSESYRQTWIGIIAMMLTAAVAEFAMGRRLWGIGGEPGFWSGDIWSRHNSQFVIDPYSLTHITHGILFFGLLTLLFKALPVRVTRARGDFNRRRQPVP